MAKNDTPATPVAKQEELDRIERLVRWARANERTVAIVAGAVALAGAGVWFAISAKERRENFARRELDRARMSAESGNLPLAANDLSRIVSGYGRTTAGQEAQLVLAQVRLLQNQPALAVSQLQEFVAKGPGTQFVAPAYEMLGVALEQTGQLRPAAEAFVKAADASEYALLKGRLLLSAGQAYASTGDTAAAAGLFERVMRDFEESSLASEAKLRLAELGRYQS
jgi:predicted negative regulator of RcsB-dependent stress response